MRILTLLIPVAAVGIFFGANAYLTPSADRVEDVAVATDKGPAKQATTRNAKGAAAPIADADKDAPASGKNMILAWFAEKFGGRGGKDKGSDAGKGYGFKYGKCERVGQAKRCKAE